MVSLRWRRSFVLLFAVLPACGFLTRGCAPTPLSETAFGALYNTPLPPADAPLAVYHLGHSLVGQDMPVMLQQLAGDGHEFHSQLGWGANLNEHWDPDIPVKGFAESNSHPQHRDPHEAIASGDYDVIVVTEAVEIRDSIKYAEPARFLREIAVAAREANPEVRVYFYETWHRIDHEEGWLARLDRDLGLYWEGEILRRTLAYHDVDRPIYVVPGGQVMAAFARALDDLGPVGSLRHYSDLFSDHIHFNDYGAYLMALTHYAVLYGRSPVGLPHGLTRSDGRPADDPGEAAALLMQETVWQVVTSYPPSGVAGQ